jgi:hypothetical protein
MKRRNAEERTKRKKAFKYSNLFREKYRQLFIYYNKETNSHINELQIKYMATIQVPEEIRLYHQQEEKMTWKKLVERQIDAKTLKGVTCHIYSSKSEQTDEETKPCICGRLPRRHSFHHYPSTGNQNCTTFDYEKHACEVPLNVYGILKNEARV